MLTVTIQGPNSALSLYTLELSVQCQIYQHIFRRLELAAKVELNEVSPETSGYPRSAIELFADCGALLSAVSVMSKLLFTGVSAKPDVLARSAQLALATNRSAALRQLLLIEDLPTLRSLAVRNSFEHVDERIDRQAKNNLSGTFVWLNMSRHEPTSGLPLKRFNPNTMAISYLEEELPLVPCSHEVAIVAECLVGTQAYVRTFKPLASAVSAGG